MIYVVIGRRELGKTTYGYFLTSQAPKRIVFDPRGMFATEHNSPARFTIRSPERIASWQRGHPLRVEQADGTDLNIDPVEITITPDGQLERAFSLTTRKAEAMVKNGERFALLLDEFRFIDKATQKGDESLNWILRCAERGKVDVIMTAHRPVDIHPDIRAIADHYILFRMTQASDLNFLDEQCGSECAKAVGALAGRECIHWDDTVSSMTVQKDPGKWFTKLGPAVHVETVASGVPTRPLFDKPIRSV
jgi:hypothetical protein